MGYDIFNSSIGNILLKIEWRLLSTRCSFVKKSLHCHCLRCNYQYSNFHHENRIGHIGFETLQFPFLINIRISRDNTVLHFACECLLGTNTTVANCTVIGALANCTDQEKPPFIYHLKTFMKIERGFLRGDDSIGWLITRNEGKITESGTWEFRLWKPKTWL